MTMRESLREKIAEVVVEYAGNTAMPDFSVAVPDNPEHGDYATNVAMMLAKTLNKKPLEIAGELAKKLADDRWAVTVAPPGFLNVIVSENVLLENMQNILQKSEAWGTSNEGADKTVIVEYFQLNIAKRPHIGHLRSAVIGDALKRIFLSQGYTTLSDTHVGDWGTQFGILLLGYKEFSAQADTKKIIEDPFALLEDIYTKENAKIETDPKRRDFAKEEFAKLERGDAENRKIWQWMVDVSMKKLEESVQRLELLSFDEHKGESSYEADMPVIAEEALQKGVAIKKEDGAVVADLTQEKLDEAVLIKSDGASTYLLRDLATIKYRKEKWNFWKNLYLVDVRQSHHFKQLFRVADLLGYEGVGESEHAEFGFMKLPEGAMSTRKGTAIALDALLDEAEKRARGGIKEKNPDLADADKVAKQIGLGAIKYFDLSHHRKSDIIFIWDKALSFEGNTGPYLQYTHARLKSILRKAGDISFQKIDAEECRPEERQVLAALLRFPEAIEDTLHVLSPHVLAGYVYELASSVNEFYHTLPVLQETDNKKRIFRLALVTVAATTIKNGLYLLGIEAPEEM